MSDDSPLRPVDMFGRSLSPSIDDQSRCRATREPAWLLPKDTAVGSTCTVDEHKPGNQLDEEKSAPNRLVGLGTRPALISRLLVAALPATRGLDTWPAPSSCMCGALHTIHWHGGMLQPLPLALSWSSFLSSPAFRARLLVVKVRSEPACHSSAPLTTAIDCAA